MQKEAIGSIQPVKKSNTNLILVIIIIIILLIILCVLAYLGYDYIKNKPPKVNGTEPNKTNISDTNPVDNSKPGDTSNPKTSVCGDGKCNGTENYTNCAKDCKKPSGGEGGNGDCTPNCAGKQCGSNGCNGTCGTCSFGYECNSTFNCSLISCTNDTGCDKKDLLCSGSMPYNCTNTDEDICLERTNLTACSSGWQCSNGTGCIEIKDCTTANVKVDCASSFKECSYGICNSTGKCETKFNSSVICKVSTGVCDITEKCSGSSAACPTDVFNSSSTICKAALGICDAVEKCTGSSGACPADIFNLTSDTCRASAFECDAADMCTGSSISCSDDANKSNGVPCTGGTCQNGKCLVSSTCAGTDVSCGTFPNCANCNLQDTCSSSDYIDYYCSGTSCNSRISINPCNLLGYECGTQTICGQGVNCGTCTSGTCNSTGKCQQTCTPNCQGKVCGDNGCGTGTCPPGCSSGQTCTNGQCIESSSPYDQWDNGPSSDPNFFPIGVWMQVAGNIDKYRAMGINTYVALWNPVDETQLSAFKAKNMPVIASQNNYGLTSPDNDMLVGWFSMDEPDCAQLKSDGTCCGPCIATSVVQQKNSAIKSKDSTRPVYINFGPGVGKEDWNGRGSECFGRLDMYPEYIKDAGIISFDIYPVTSGWPFSDLADGVERLVSWSNGNKVVWNIIETTHIYNDAKRPTADQIKSEVWISIIHGSMGITYFVHEWKPSFREDGIFNYPEIVGNVTEINQRIISLAPVLNSPTIKGEDSVVTNNANIKVKTMLKEYNGFTYLFAVSMGESPVVATFSFNNLAAGTGEVIDENRNINIANSKFQDNFNKPYEVHIYKITKVGISSQSSLHSFKGFWSWLKDFFKS